MAEKHLFVKTICHRSYKENSGQKHDCSEGKHAGGVTESIPQLGWSWWLVLLFAELSLQEELGASLNKLCSTFLSE